MASGGPGYLSPGAGTMHMTPNSRLKVRLVSGAVGLGFGKGHGFTKLGKLTKTFSLK